MLRELSIRNFAIIDDLRMAFAPGLTVLSGETGAGKTIIIEAVNLLLGSRASSKLIRSGAEAAELEALFELHPDAPSARAMADLGYNPADGLLIRRIVSINDRHRVYINDRLATMQALGAITENLASISGQHAHQLLLREDQHLLILDQFGGLLPMRRRVREQFQAFTPLLAQRDKLQRQEQQRREQREWLEFQHREIREAAVAPEEDAQLEKEKLRLKNARNLLQLVGDCVEGLYSGEGSINDRLGEVRKQLDGACRMDADLSPLAVRAEEVAFQIEDLARELRGYLRTLESDDQRLEAVEARLDRLNRLKRKYGGTLGAVLERLDAVSGELEDLDGLADQIAATERQMTEVGQRLREAAAELSAGRSAAARRLARKVEQELAGLKMSRSRFCVELEGLPSQAATSTYLTHNGSEIQETGMDRARFMIAPNVGEDLKPLAVIASGGELSRVVLALKAILASTEAVGTVVFDEVDAGIGGGVAELVGLKLRQLARHHQIICITHLPQIARFGEHHFRIDKRVVKGRTATTIARLEETQRVEEIARMLGGLEITPATLAHARELLSGGEGRPDPA
jgi:DNA repair protein RecN (Recombination protein N)